MRQSLQITVYQTFQEKALSLTKKQLHRPLFPWQEYILSEWKNILETILLTHHQCCSELQKMSSVSLLRELCCFWHFKIWWFWPRKIGTSLLFFWVKQSVTDVLLSACTSKRLFWSVLMWWAGYKMIMSHQAVSITCPITNCASGKTLWAWSFSTNHQTVGDSFLSAWLKCLCTIWF